MLRQWWRVAYANENNYTRKDYKEMRREEGLLFGNAWLKDNIGRNLHKKSSVRISLSNWMDGGLKKLGDKEFKTKHPEVKFPIGGLLYLGYGALIYEKGKGTVLKGLNAIDTNEQYVLTVSYYEDKGKSLIPETISLISRFGSVGGRSRNGWGSLYLEGMDDESKKVLKNNNIPLREWNKAMELSWPHAIGKDNEGPLIWKIGPGSDWQKIMMEFAPIKIGLRTQFAFKGKVPEDRHWLSYPVTNHKISKWEKRSLRLPNSLRFKIRREENGELIGVIFHVPHMPPDEFEPQRENVIRVWRDVHKYLDGKLVRIRG